MYTSDAAQINVKIVIVFSYKFYQLCFCQILFELVHSLECYHRNYKGELFIETQCAGWLKIKYPTRQYAISPQPVV